MQHDIRTLVPDSRDIHSRPRRFLGALTSLISLGMGAFRTYQQRVIKGQIRRIHSDLSHLRQNDDILKDCLLYTSPSPRDRQKSRMPSSA